MRRFLVGLLLALACFVPRSSEATFHFLFIEEVYFGTAADPTAQYVVLRDPVGGQNLVNGHTVTVQDEDGTPLSDFGTFAQDAPNGAAGSYIIIGTASAQAMFGIPFDAVAMGSLPFPSGRICFDVTEVDCIAYGAYTGSNTQFGAPAPTPIRGQVLTRVSATDVNTDDFVGCEPHPFNNAGQAGGSSTMFCNVCPNGYPSANEECDDGNMLNTDSCVAGCVNSSCGDGFVRTGFEACDNGAANSNTTPNACRLDCTTARCGDSVVDMGEQCDNGSANSNSMPNACRMNCLNARCGDFVTDMGEMCDDGNQNNTDACVMGCQIATCGDGFVRTGVEQCDPPNGTTCNAMCRVIAPDAGVTTDGSAAADVFLPQDGQVPEDVGIVEDGGVIDDGGVIEDGGPIEDAGPVDLGTRDTGDSPDRVDPDAASNPDATASPDATTGGRDATAGRDAATMPGTGGGGGCSCATTETQTRARSAAALLALFGIAVAFRRSTRTP